MKLQSKTSLALAALIAAFTVNSVSADTITPKAKDHSSFFRQLSNFQRSLSQSANALQAAADAPQPEDIRLGLHKFPQTAYDANEVTATGAPYYQQSSENKPNMTATAIPAMQAPYTNQAVAAHQMYTVPEAQTFKVTRVQQVSSSHPVSTTTMPIQQAMNPMDTSMPLHARFDEVDSLYKIDGWERLQSTLTLTKNGRPYQKMLTYVVLPGEKTSVSMSTRTKTNSYYEETSNGVRRISKNLFTTLVDYVAPINDTDYTVHMEITTPNEIPTDFSIRKGLTKDFIKGHIPSSVAPYGDQTKTPQHYSYYLDTDRWFAGKTVSLSTNGIRPGSETTVITNTADASIVVTVSTPDEKTKDIARDFAYTLARYVNIKDLV